MTLPKDYVTGFLFSSDKSSVVLIEKLKPVKHRCMFNGLGGKVEDGELPRDAISREVAEECGLDVPPSDWIHFLTLHRPGEYRASFLFACSDTIFAAKTLEVEKVRIFPVSKLPDASVYNLRWLIPLCLDKKLVFSSPIELIQDRRPKSIKHCACLKANSHLPKWSR